MKKILTCLAFIFWSGTIGGTPAQIVSYDNGDPSDLQPHLELKIMGIWVPYKLHINDFKKIGQDQIPGIFRDNEI